MIKKILLAAFISGIVAGLPLTVIQEWVVTPLILEAETYEVELHVGDHAETEDTWAPSDGLERSLFTALSNIGAGIGFSLLIIIGLIFHSGRVWWHGLVWGMCGVTAFYLVPTLAYPPALPSTLQSDVLVRQLWWLATVEGTIFGMALIIFARNWVGRTVGAVVIAMPHLIGVPPGEALQFVPQALASYFFVVNIIINVAFWLVLGMVTVVIYRRLEVRGSSSADGAASIEPVKAGAIHTQYRSFDLAYRILGLLVLVAFFLSLYMAHSHAKLSQENVAFLGHLSQSVTNVDNIAQRITELNYHTVQPLDALARAQTLEGVLRKSSDRLFSRLNGLPIEPVSESPVTIQVSLLIGATQSIIPRIIAIVNESGDHFAQSASWLNLRPEMDRIRAGLDKAAIDLIESTNDYGEHTYGKSIQLLVIEYALLLIFPLIAGAFSIYGDHTSQRIRYEINEQTRSLQIALDEKNSAADELRLMNHTLEERVRLRTRKLEEAQQQLVDAAHKSGMAEIAIGVLHNIGNILNSVMLSGSEIARVVKARDMQGLHKANGMLAAHHHDAAEFLSRDQKGRLLPQYYLALGEALAAEYILIANEIASLNDKTTMMKDVIATQQSYARAGLYVENLDISLIVEVALRVQESLINNSGVNLQCQYRAHPLCAVHKSKLLQIVTNLIKNACEAIESRDSHNLAKDLMIEVGQHDADFAYLRVTDNGCGIAKENRVAIFNHGFTTKAKGHGFGLHTSALAVKEMGGEIRVHSDGVGLGATFTLLIPLAKDSTLVGNGTTLSQEAIREREELT